MPFRGRFRFFYRFQSDQLQIFLWSYAAIKDGDLPLEDAVIVDSAAVLSAGKTFACREHFCGISIYPPQKAMGIVTGLFVSRCKKVINCCVQFLRVYAL